MPPGRPWHGDAHRHHASGGSSGPSRFIGVGFTEKIPVLLRADLDVVGAGRLHRLVARPASGRGRRKHLRLVLGLLVAEIAAFTAPLSVVVIVPVVVFSRWRRKRAVTAASVPETPASSS